jgi:lysozyme
MENKGRVAVASLVVSASTLVGIAFHEGYLGTAYKDVTGVATIGFGETKDVKMGQTTDPVRALIRLEASANEHAKGIAKCIKVPLYQYEFDAYVDFAYNVGVGAFCNSTLNKKLNSGDYAGACSELLRWNRAGGQVLAGLTKRRQAEYQTCMGNVDAN